MHAPARKMVSPLELEGKDKLCRYKDDKQKETITMECSHSIVTIS